MDWGELFRIDAPPLEIILRGSLVYWALFLLFRFVLRRNVGSIGIADILFVVLVADAAQNSMIGDSYSVIDGLILICTLAAWNRLFDWANFQFPALRRLMEPPPLLLVRDGRIQIENLRQERITQEELEAKIRSSGLERLDDTSSVYMESDGTVSVIPKKANTGAKSGPSHGAVPGSR